MRSLAAAAVLLVCVPLDAGLKVGDARGREVSNATVTILIDSQSRASTVFGDEPVVHKTNDHGALPFDVPRIDGATVVVDHEQYAPALLTVDSARTPASITLSEGMTLDGRIVGDGHIPAGPGRVCAVRPVVTHRNGSTFEIRRCAGVDDGGAFTLHALADGAQRLEIEVPAYLPLTKTISLPAGHWDGTLESGLRALVHVEDPAGRPARATVECDGAVPVTTDARGTALVSLSHSGAKCRAFASDGSESRALEIEAPSNARQMLRLRPARLVTGTLVTDDGGESAAPRFTLLGKIGEVGQSATRAEPVSMRGGAFRIRLPENGPNALRIEAPGMLPMTTDWFTLPPGGGTADLGVLLLRRGAGIRGRVVHALTQQPLAGAVVSLEAQGRARLVLGRFGKASTLTDGDGSFVVGGVGIGAYRMRVAWRDLPPYETAIDLLEERVETTNPIALHPGVRVSGKAARNDGEPLSAVRVELVPSRAYDAEPVAFTYTATDGAFGPVAIAPGTYRLLVRGDDILSDQEIEVPADEDAMHVDAIIRSTRLTGVIRERGVPVTGGEVLLRRSLDLRGNLGVALARNPRAGTQVWSGRSDSQFQATVNGDGIFVVDDAPAGRMVLEYFGAGDRVTRTIEVPDETDAAVVVDIDGWALQGRVDDGEIESGLAALVELVGGDGTAIFRGATDASGGFVVDRVAAGTYNLVASAPGYRSSDPLRILVGSEAPQPVQIRLMKAEDATLDLELKRDDAIPAAGVAVAIMDAAGRQLRAVPTWPDGKLHLTGLPPGRVHIIWSDPLAGVGTLPPIQLRPGAQEVSVHLQPGKDLIARCESTDCSGTRLGSLAFTTEHGIDLAPFLQRMGAVVYSDRGTAYLGRLAPGTYGVSTGSGALHFDQRLELGSGPGEVALFLTKR